MGRMTLKRRWVLLCSLLVIGAIVILGPYRLSPAVSSRRAGEVKLLVRFRGGAALINETPVRAYLSVARRLGPLWDRSQIGVIPPATQERPLSVTIIGHFGGRFPDGCVILAGQVRDVRVVAIRVGDEVAIPAGGYYLFVRSPAAQTEVNLSADALDAHGVVLYRLGPSTNMEWVSENQISKR